MKENQFSNLKETIQKVQKLSKSNHVFESRDVDGWQIHESTLMGREHSSFNERFHGLYSKKYNNIKEYIEDELNNKEGSAVGIEIGGTGSNLFSEFSPGFFKKTLGVALLDKRSQQQKQRDRITTHSVLETDALSTSGFKKVEKELANKKVNVIFEKMHGALRYFPDNLEFMSSVLNKWYKLLDDKGIMFIETPRIRDRNKIIEIKKTLDKISFIEGIELSYAIRDMSGNNSSNDSYNLNSKDGVTFWIRLQKDEGAIDDLRSAYTL